MQRIIVNSTPLITLGNIGMLWLLKELYDTVIIPNAVFDEVTQKSDLAKSEIMNSDWIKVEQIDDMSERKMYRAKLHAGEVEVMILAQREPKADMVIIDDNAAKKTAKYLGLEVTGTLGVLLVAKDRGLIKEIKPVLDDMIFQGFYITPEVLQKVLTLAGE